jgi:hypothetical protein
MSAMSNAQVVTKARLFTETKWSEISDAVSKAFRMTTKEREALKEKRVARLIAAIPFLAECEDAERTAVAHVGTYLLSVRETKRYFNAKPDDSESVTERLRLISNFKGGDQRIIERGMNLLALNMVSDYRRDAEEDVFLRKYNPVSEGDFDYESTIGELKERIEEVPCSEMDKIMSLSFALLDFWSVG